MPIGLCLSDIKTLLGLPWGALICNVKILTLFRCPTVGPVFRILALKAKALGFSLKSLKSDAMLPTTRHCYGFFSKGAELFEPYDAEMGSWALQTRSRFVIT